ncbi:MAG: aldo/keto reductase [Actinobacteria bacterium]|nr:aldo/keto reductase [Actinomycetota bacterium]
MKYRSLGGSGCRVSEIALGNWETHGQQIDNDAARACVEAAIDNGINFFDTADVYARGRAEQVLGEIVKGRARSDLVIATKCFWSTGPGPNDRGLSRKHVMEACEASLNRLQMDYVDLYQAHRYDIHTPLEETMRAWNDLVTQGKALYIGVSEWTAEQMTEAQAIAGDMGFNRIITNQPQYSMLWRVPEESVIPMSRGSGIGQIVWSPLAMGVLTGKYEPGRQPPRDSRAAQGGAVGSHFMKDETLEAVQRLRPIADEVGLSMANLALAWVLQNDNVSAAIMGASRPEQVHENVKASGVRLDDELMGRIDEALKGVIVRDVERDLDDADRDDD